MTRAGHDAGNTGPAVVPDAQGAIFLRLGKAYNAATQAFESLTGIGAPRWRLLFLAHLQPGLSQKEITAQVRVNPGAITRQLHALEHAGWIARRDDARDTRLTRIHLTRRGTSLVRSVLRQREAFLQQMTAGIPPAELADAVTVLERIATNLGDHEPLPQANERLPASRRRQQATPTTTTMNTRSLVLIPGLNNTRAVFTRLQSALGETPGLAVQAVDNPPLETVEAIAAALLPELPDRFWLAGFSFGGYVAMALLAHAPERVQGIALLCSAPGADSPAAAAKRLASIEAAEQGRYLEMVQSTTASAFHPDRQSDAVLMDERMHMVGDYGAQRFIAHVRATMARPDRSPLLNGDRPTLVVGGSHDPLFTPQALSYADAIPGVRRVTIAGAAHLVPMEQPAALAQALLAWMGAR